MDKKILGTISILTSNRQSNSIKMNNLLTEYGHHIMSRLGVNVNLKCVEQCPGLIALAVNSSKDVLVELVAKLNGIEDIKAELCILDEE